MSLLSGDEAYRLAKKLLGESSESLIGKINNVIQMVTDLSGLTKKRIVYYGVCDTAAATQTKVVSIPEITEYYTGLHLRIKFTNNQNFEGTPTLKINSLNAKSIRRLTGTNAQRLEWQDGEVVDFVFDGTNFVIVDGGRASTSYFGVTKLSSSTSSSEEYLAATPKAVKAAYDLADSKLSPSDLNLFDVITPSFSSLPSTFYSDKLTTSCKLVGNAIELSAPKAGDIDWSVSFANGSLTISGTFHGNTATTAKMSVWLPTETITLTNS